MPAITFEQSRIFWCYFADIWAFSTQFNKVGYRKTYFYEQTSINYKIQHRL